MEAEAKVRAQRIKAYRGLQQDRAAQVEMVFAGKDAGRATLSNFTPS